MIVQVLAVILIVALGVSLGLWITHNIRVDVDVAGNQFGDGCAPGGAY